MTMPKLSAAVMAMLCQLAMLLFCTGVLALPEATLQVGATRYMGVVLGEGEVEQFLGIPFAQPPVGPLRWRAPQPLQDTPTRAEALAFAPACAQGNHIVTWYRGVVTDFGGDPDVVVAPEFSEDCLYLNIWRPRGPASPALPVIVYIHGGSNVGGWSYEPNYMGEKLARKGVIVVSIAYRLGVFGFLAHPQLQQSNFALLDQIAALRWIAGHIAAAGGDPERITVMGESAGASNIAYLMASPLAGGLFQRVIHQSAGWALTAGDTAADARNKGLALQRALTGETGNLDGLRGLPTDAVLAASDRVYEGYVFDPVVDGNTLTRTLAASVEAGDFAPVDLLIGSNADEWLMYIEAGQTLEQWLHDNLAADIIPSIVELLPAAASEAQQLDRLITAREFVCPSLSLAGEVDRRGARSWFYYFSRQREGKQAAAMGAYHGAELPYLFDTHDDWLPTDDVDRQLTETMMSYWVNFARDGDPNGPGLPHWPRFREETGLTQVLDRTIESRRHGSRELCELLMPVGSS